MATTVLYNYVTIHNCVTREFDQELLYDASGTDLVAVRYKIGVEGYVHAQQAAGSGHGIQEVGGPTSTGPCPSPGAGTAATPYRRPGKAAVDAVRRAGRCLPPCLLKVT